MTQTMKNIVESHVYRLETPYQFKVEKVNRHFSENEVVVEPSLASICHADLRYFTGSRNPEVLKRKLPMALLHEGIGTIIESQAPEHQIGQRVVIVPNLPGYLLKHTEREDCCLSCQSEASENYCEQGAFLGSGYDGIGQSRLVLPSECAIPIPPEIPDEIAVLAELCSVSYEAILNIAQSITMDSKVAVFGDGPVGYLTAALLHHVYNLDADQLTVFGADESKLANFTFANCKMVQSTDFKNDINLDIVVECTGGTFSESAINQAIDALNPKGKIVLMGVTENKVLINTRDVLEKGITLHGSSRSTYKTFRTVINAMCDQNYQRTLRKILPQMVNEIRNELDFYRIMKEAEEHRSWQKVLLQFHW
ncbi:alcohol dehydrogenase catalytic domain-containing protein [Neobacillus mesonae]|uniref:alcohol dehydrogenase catalytic domain-containing protein n=1 Tax=Neobacillus mesonae TaxID=1193713 RepID=UPI00203DC0E0|nr:alcohol dehydrogenase catalytic domain-containing protein [Neobacillus mesonae]MCM3571155.1 alcohol dehydrogenase catalytic domain-containing protein [Neobacillus mesonae]